MIVLTTALYYLLGGDTHFAGDASGDVVFHVDLEKGRYYELWVLDMNGPETVRVSVANGSYVAYGDTFRLMHPEGDYLPYHSGFTVKETGHYDITVHPLDPGAIRVAIKQDTGLSPYRVIRDLGNLINGL